MTAAAPDIPLELTIARRYAAPRERVFDAWLDRTLARFMTPGAGMTVPRAGTDPREGGRFEIVMATVEAELPHTGTYLRIARPVLLEVTRESAHSLPDSVVTLTFEEAGEGGTLLALRHVRFAGEQMRDNHRGGRTAILAALESAL